MIKPKLGIFLNMSNWNAFLTGQGAHFSADAPAEVADFGREASAATLAVGFVAPISDLGLIAATGSDSADFLHKQLTNDVEHLGPAELRLAGYCSPKGRLLATLLMWRDADAIMLQVPVEIMAALQKRLQMFIMRAKVTLTDAGAEPRRAVTLGLGGAAAQSVLASWFDVLPAAPYTHVGHALGSLLRVADAWGAPRYQWIMDAEAAQSVWPVLTQALTPVGNSAWRLSGIVAGVPQITLATQEKFVPQMINFELIGGVNFKKGCYPGQEIVARSQYLGKVKRRTLFASVASDGAKAGMEVYSSADPDQPCGMIVNAERASVTANDPAPSMLCLVEIKTAAVEAGEVRLGAIGGPALSFMKMPYSLAAETD
jgi:folate-binding protein YgfZ